VHQRLYNLIGIVNAAGNRALQDESSSGHMRDSVPETLGVKFFEDCSELLDYEQAGSRTK
jgi:hypothetical protein